MTEWSELVLGALLCYSAGASSALVKFRDKDQAKADERYSALVTRLANIERKTDWVADQIKMRIR